MLKALLLVSKFLGFVNSADKNSDRLYLAVHRELQLSRKAMPSGGKIISDALAEMWLLTKLIKW